MRSRIQLDPEYQRLGNIWSPDNRQLLIDTILNDFDIPKIYLHKFSKPLVRGSRTYEYAIIDGKQRLETLWNFIEGKFAIADDFLLYKDSDILAGGMTYRDLGLNYPELKADFDGFQLSVQLIETEEIDMIEEMFSRLNEAAPLTAAEKRNAYGGPVPTAIRKLAKENFFIQAVPFPNKRYRHFDLAAKFLVTENEEKVVDTKKARLDAFVRSFENQLRTKSLPFVREAQQNLQAMSLVFTKSDSLLRQVGMVMLYYHLFRVARNDGWEDEITRRKLVEFDKRRELNKAAFEKGDSKHVDLDLIEFERHAQSPNDASAVRFRLEIIVERAFKRKLGSEEY